MAATIQNMTITGGGQSYTIPVPVTITPSGNALDAETSGRDNSTGTMHRDLIAAKKKYTIGFPSGMTNQQVSSLYNIIIKNANYTITVPDVETGDFQALSVYTSELTPDIDEVQTDSAGNWISWTYKEFQISAIEL